MRKCTFAQVIITQLLLHSHFIGGGTTRKFQKGCTVLSGNPDKKYDYCITLPRTFVHDCSYPSQSSRPTHPSPLCIPVTSHLTVIILGIPIILVIVVIAPTLASPPSE